MGLYVVCPFRDRKIGNYETMKRLPTLKHSILNFKLTGAEKLQFPSSEVNLYVFRCQLLLYCGVRASDIRLG